MKAGNWEPDGSRTLFSSMPALVDIANRSSKPLKGFSKTLAYAAPDVLADESAVALSSNEAVTEDDAEPSPLALHAKLVCFHLGDMTIFITRSANATERAWAGRNSEAMVELEAGDAFTSGVEFLVGKATPVSIEDLAATAPPSSSEADALEESRKLLMASWNPTLRRNGEQFLIDAGAPPLLAYQDHQLHAGSASATASSSNLMHDISRLIWNRLRYIKDPSTGKRVSRLNPKSEWIIRDVPDLHIFDDELWQSVRVRQGEIAENFSNLTEAVSKHHKKNRLNSTCRPKSLLSGLVFCGCCGGPYSLCGADRFACSNHISKGACLNSRTILREDLEARVFSGLKDRMMAPEIVEEAMRAYAEETITGRTVNAALAVMPGRLNW